MEQPAKKPVVSKPEIQAAVDALAKKKVVNTKQIAAVVKQLVFSGTVRPEAGPVLSAVLVNLDDIVARRDAAQRGSRLVNPLEERYFVGGEREADTAEEREALTTVRGLKGRTPAPKVESSLPPALYDATLEALDSASGRKLADRIIRREDRADRLPSPSRKRDGVTRAPITELQQSGEARRVIDGLPEDQRQALVLSIRHRQNEFDIAEQMGITPKHAKDLIRKANEKITDAFDKFDKKTRTRLGKEKRREMYEQLMAQAAAASERAEPEPPAGPYEGPGSPASYPPRTARAGKLPRPVTTIKRDKSGKVVGGGKEIKFTYTNEQTGKEVPKYYSRKILQAEYDKRSTIPPESRPPLEKTALYRLNEQARKGDFRAAVQLQRELNRMFGEKDLFKTTPAMKKIKGEWVKDPKGRVNTPEKKQRGRNFREAKGMGMGPSELAKKIQKDRKLPFLSREERASRDVGDEMPVSEGRSAVQSPQIDQADLRKRARILLEEKFRNGRIGPLRAETESRIRERLPETVKEMTPPRRLVEKVGVEQAAELIRVRKQAEIELETELRKGHVGPLTKEMQAEIDRELPVRMREIMSTPYRRKDPEEPSGLPIGRPRPVPSPDRAAPTPPKGPRSVMDVLARLKRIQRASGRKGVREYLKPIGPDPDLVKEIRITTPPSAPMGKARSGGRKQILRTPGRGPGLREQAFSMLARRFMR